MQPFPLHEAYHSVVLAMFGKGTCEAVQYIDFAPFLGEGVDRFFGILPDSLGVLPALSLGQYPPKLYQHPGLASLSGKGTDPSLSVLPDPFGVLPALRPSECTAQFCQRPRFALFVGNGVDHPLGVLPALSLS